MMRGWTLLAGVVAAALAYGVAVSQPADPPPNFTATSPITITPSGASFAQRTIACPTCGTGTGSVSNVASGTGLTGGPITTTGTLSLASLSANQVLGSLTAVAPSGLSLPSCSAATSALTWTTATGFGCNTITASAFPITAAGATQSVGQMTVTGTNAGMAAVPNGTGSFMLAIPDGSTTGGNARGNNSADLQTTRAINTQVASGTGSFAAGQSNIASGINSVAAGITNIASNTGAVALGDSNNVSVTHSVGLGWANTVSGAQSIAAGRGNTVSGQSSSAFGEFGTVAGGTSFGFGSRFNDRSNAGVVFYGQTEAGGTGGDWEYHLFYNSGNTASAFRLTQGGNAAAASTCASISAGSAALFRVDLIAVDSTSFHSWVFSMGPALITRSGAVGTTAMGTGNPVFVAGPTDATAPAIATVPTATADTTNGCLNVSFTPPAGNTDTIKVSARVQYIWRF